jgi:hypothetical protein
MAGSGGERGLRERFGSLRAELSAVTPAFNVVANRPRPAKRARWELAAAAVAAAALVLWVTGVNRDATTETGLDLSTTAWIAPTDFLLDTPGRDLLRTLPEINVAAYVPQPITPERGTIDTSS